MNIGYSGSIPQWDSSDIFQAGSNINGYSVVTYRVIAGKKKQHRTILHDSSHATSRAQWRWPIKGGDLGIQEGHRSFTPGKVQKWDD